MTRFFKLFLYTFLFSLTLVSCADPDDRNAYLSSLRLAAFWDETPEIMTDLEVDAELNPDFEPRTKIYTAKASCVTDSVNVLAFAAYPGLDLTVAVNGGTPVSSTTPVNVPIPLKATTAISIYMSGDTFIETTYQIDVTRGDEGDPPAIALLGGLVVNHTLGVKYEDPGKYACNRLGVDISNTVTVVGDKSVNFEEIGTNLITYDVEDNGLNAVQVIRTVNVVENTAPVITLTGSASVTIEQGADYNDGGATAFDAQELDISDQIDTDGSDIISTAVLGTFTVTYNVTDTGELPATQVTRTVEVVAAP